MPFRGRHPERNSSLSSKLYTLELKQLPLHLTGNVGKCVYVTNPETLEVKRKFFYCKCPSSQDSSLKILEEDEKDHTHQTMFSHQSKLANCQLVLGCIASDITEHEENLHFMKSHQVAQIHFTMKCSHRPTRYLDNIVSAKFKWVSRGFDEAGYTAKYK